MRIPGISYLRFANKATFLAYGHSLIYNQHFYMQTLEVINKNLTEVFLTTPKNIALPSWQTYLSTLISSKELSIQIEKKEIEKLKGKKGTYTDSAKGIKQFNDRVQSYLFNSELALISLLLPTDNEVNCTDLVKTINEMKSNMLQCLVTSATKTPRISYEFASMKLGVVTLLKAFSMSSSETKLKNLLELIIKNKEPGYEIIQLVLPSSFKLILASAPPTQPIPIEPIPIKPQDKNIIPPFFNKSNIETSVNNIIKEMETLSSSSEEPSPKRMKKNST